jgi:ketosteroid isomerase-like protein
MGDSENAPRNTGQVSREDVELVRQLYAELAGGDSPRELERRLTDDVLAAFLDPAIEWIPVSESLLADDTYRGFEGVRRFWTEFLSTWDEYRVEPQEFYEARDQLAVVVRITGRTHGLEIDQTHSSLVTVRDGKVVRVEAFADPHAAREAAGPPRQPRARP